MNYSISKSIKLFLVALLCVFTTQTKAGHILGTHITYIYLSPNTYKVKVAFYRDCQGLSANPLASVCYKSVSSGLSGSIPLTILTPAYVLPPFPYIPPVMSSCSGGPGLGIERVVYEGTLVLPAAMPDWILSYSTFPQNIGINQNFMYVSTKIDNLNYPINSSAKYLNDPTFIYCVNQPAWDNFVCTDSDGDSLSYHKIPILDNTTVCPHAPFQNPVPAFPPLQSSTPIVMDSTNGSLTFSPSMVGQAMVSARVDEFRNGILINSSTVEHVMYLVTGCVISGVNEPQPLKINTYPNPVNDLLHIDFEISDAPVLAEITDVTGKTFSSEFFENANNNYSIDVKLLAAGLYTLKITSAKGTAFGKFLKL
jgi:hypothetical protein